MRQPWTRLYDGLDFELEQARSENRALDAQTIAAVEEAAALPEDDERKSIAAANAFERVQALGYVDGACSEPDELEAIQALATGNAAVDVPRDALYDKAYGGWLGRSAGCLLGKPVECWSRESIATLLKGTDNYPIHNYMRGDVSDELKAAVDACQRPGMKHSFVPHRAFINEVDCMPEDDDTNYTIIGLKTLETYGRDFTPDDVADCWLGNLPYYHLCTAERVAYRNLVMCLKPPKSAAYCNVYREWIGAQIRADMFGYVNPGNPRIAADMAWRDGCISHVKNGIYGEMWVAAMLAMAYASDDVEVVIRAGMAEIPAHSRLHEALEKVLAWWHEDVSWTEALQRVYAQWDENSFHHWTHTVSNAQIVAIALLFGEKDLEKTLGIAVMAGFDTDCNGATAGSVLGVMLGAQALPEKWTAPLNDTLESGVDGFGRVRISDMAKRTVALMAADR